MDAIKERAKKYYELNRDKVKAQSKKWKEDNKDRHKELRSKWLAENKDKVKEYRKKYYETYKYSPTYIKYCSDNAGRKNARSSAWRKANPEKAKKLVSEWYLSNKKATDERIANWRKNNADRVKATLAAYRESHQEACSAYGHNYRARIKSNGGTLSKDIIQKLWKLQKGKCAVCKVDLRKTGYHLDHVIPLKPRDGSTPGKNDDRNVQLTCPVCNLKKNNKNPIQFMQDQGYLL